MLAHVMSGFPCLMYGIPHHCSAVMKPTVDRVSQGPCHAEGFEEAHRFSSYANWIIPGHVMLGRYPYVEPSRCR